MCAADRARTRWQRTHQIPSGRVRSCKRYPEGSVTALLYLPGWNRAHPCVSSCGTFPFSRSLSCLGSLSFLCPAMSCNLLKNTACIKPCLNSAILQGGKAHSRAWATQPARQGLGSAVGVCTQAPCPVQHALCTNGCSWGANDS